MTVKPRQSVKLTDPQTAFLNAEAQELGITVAELIRRIIDEYRQTRMWKDYAAQLKAENPTLYKEPT